MEASKNQMEMDKKAIDELVREKAILNKVCMDMCFKFSSRKTFTDKPMFFLACQLNFNIYCLNL